MRRDRGFTLNEVMVALVVIGSTCATTVAVGEAIRSEQRQADASARDLRAASRVLDLASEDVRAGRYEDARWTLMKGVLSRGDEVVARGVRSFDAKSDGGTTRISIAIGPRSFDPGATGNTVAEVVVRPRTVGAP